MVEPFLGEIRLFAGTYAPRDWAFCDGRLLLINNNRSLFSLISTRYGGDGHTTFALPDFRGRVPVHRGRGPGLTNRKLGQRDGVETVTLTTPHIPDHTHTMRFTTSDGQSKSPANALPGKLSSGRLYNKDQNTPDSVDMSISMLRNVGGGAHENRMPICCIYFIIALQGIFPDHD